MQRKVRKHRGARPEWMDITPGRPSPIPCHILDALPKVSPRSRTDEALRELHAALADELQAPSSCTQTEQPTAAEMITALRRDAATQPDDDPRVMQLEEKLQQLASQVLALKKELEKLRSGKTTALRSTASYSAAQQGLDSFEFEEQARLAPVLVFKGLPEVDLAELEEQVRSLPPMRAAAVGSDDIINIRQGPKALRGGSRIVFVEFSSIAVKMRVKRHGYTLAGHAICMDHALTPMQLRRRACQWREIQDAKQAGKRWCWSDQRPDELMILEMFVRAS